MEEVFEEPAHREYGTGSWHYGFAALNEVEHHLGKAMDDFPINDEW